jgi:hypothetical protein
MDKNIRENHRCCQIRTQQLTNIIFQSYQETWPY